MYGCSSDYSIEELNIDHPFKSHRDIALQVIWKTLMLGHLLFMEPLFFHVYLKIEKITFNI